MESDSSIASELAVRSPERLGRRAGMIITGAAPSPVVGDGEVEGAAVAAVAGTGATSDAVWGGERAAAREAVKAARRAAVSRNCTPQAVHETALAGEMAPVSLP